MAHASLGRRGARCRGLTQIDMIVVLALSALLTTMALPQFTRVIASNRLTSQADLLNGFLFYSRAEAIRRDMALAVCPLNAALNGCQGANGGGADWSNGAVVFQDADHSGSYSAAKELRRLQLVDAGNGNGVRIGAAPALLSFREDGHIDQAGSVLFNVLNCNNLLKNGVELSVFGRARVLGTQPASAAECA